MKTDKTDKTDKSISLIVVAKEQQSGRHEEEEQAKPAEFMRQFTYFSDLRHEKHCKLISTSLFIIFIVIILICGKLIPNISIYHLMSLLLLIIFIFWISHLLILIFSFDNLYCIVIKRKQAPNAKNVFIPYKYEEFKHIPMSSISLLVAMRGSNVEIIQIAFHYLSFGIILSTVLMKWTETNNFSKVDDELILLIISSIAAFFLPSWELEIDNKFANIMHYLLVVICIPMASIAFCMQQNWSILSIILLCATIISFAIWLLILEYIQRRDFSNSDTSLVHRFSLISILTEFVGVTFFYLCYILFIYCMASNVILKIM